VRSVDTVVAAAVLGARTVLDVRGDAAFAAGHLAGSGHVPAEALKERRTELPARDRPMLVVAARGSEARAAAGTLEQLGYADVVALDAPIEQLPGGLDERGPAARLWRPAPFLEWALARFRARLPAGPAADIAAGSGRDAVFLALEGLEVEAFDHDPGALARATALAARHGVTITAVERDLERSATPLPRSRYALIVCFRFLHRPLLPAIAAALAPGGMLIYETYKVGQERFGRPLSRRFLLSDGELAAAFPTLETLHVEESEPPEGPITARLVARRPAGPLRPEERPGDEAAFK